MNRNIKRTSYGGWIAAIIIVLAVVAAGVYLVQRGMHPAASENPPPSAPPSTAAQAPASSSSTIQHPIAQAAAGPAPASTAALPALVDSDASVREALASMVGSDMGALLAPSQIISRVVATVDALPRQGMGNTTILPLRTPRGTMQLQTANGASVIAAANAERYAPYMTVLAKVDPHALVAWYKQNYPLFQQAYRELGYPRGYFNDRLITAIDDMLAAPDVHDPIAVTKEGARYHFVDPQLQSLSNGQKLMLRLGPENEAQLKAKLRMIRTLLAGGQVGH
ncbi:DUF3014 domain-containing protein [Dyella sp.]|uniref:DUF3014 domain-containing protein n=1 Tax=Dyella sp. TaxID=1869338 RepID=UPI002D797448|nr:DUF3014 domain-containing protein [Dyella sp.]HET7329580.1 DUF3014 domain-containing protein [Dyella sp.]